MFDLDVIADEEAKTPYTFKAGGEQWRVPHVHDLTLRQQRALDRGMLPEVLRQVGERLDVETQEWVADGTALAELVLDFKGDRAGKLQAAWLTQAGLEPGN